MTESAEIKVKVRGPQQSLEIVVFPSMRYIDFKDLVASKLQISQEVDLLVGFPPDILDLDDDELIGSRIKNNESIRVQLSSLHGQQKQGKPKKPSANVSKAKKVNGVSTSEKRTIATLSNPKGIAKSTSQSSSRPTGIGRCVCYYQFNYYA